MTRTLRRNYSRSVVAAFIAILTLLIAAAVLAQETGSGRTSGNPYAVSATRGASAPSQALERRMLSGGSNAERVPVSTSQTKQYSAGPMDQNPPLFVLAAIYDSGGGGASSLTVGDVNGDGRLDVVVTNQCASASDCNHGTVGVLLGNSDGTFQSALSYNSGGYHPWSVAIRDLNGDGHPDLAVANFFNGVGVLLGNGDGTFRTPVVYNSGGFEAFSVVSSDLNGDGKPDLAVAYWCESTNSCNNGVIRVLLGNGDGTFQAPVSYSSGAYQAYSVVIGDLNGDGKPDLVAANQCQNNAFYCSYTPVTVLLGNGDGTFQAPVSYSAGGIGTASVAIGDVNGDGHLDLVTANCGNGSNKCENGTVGVLLGSGDGTFLAPVSYSSGGAKAFSVAIGDVNGDGHLDLVVANTDSNSIGVLLGNGDGTFQPAVTFDSGGFGDFSVAMADVNGDAQPDLLVSNCSALYCDYSTMPEGVVGVLLNNRPGLHISTVTTLLPSSPNPSVFGQAVTFTAQVTSDEGTPPGVVTLFDGSTMFGHTTLVNGTASISVPPLAAGTRSITAKYEGSLKFSSSTSPPITQVVSRATTTTALKADPNPAALRQWVTYDVTVSSQYGGAVSGAVVFQDGGSTIHFLILTPNNHGGGGYVTKYTSNGVHSITATYEPDANNIGSTSAPVTEYVRGPSKTTLTTSGSPTIVGQSVTFTATVTSLYGKIPDGELVTFYDGTTTLGSVALAAGKAAYTTSFLLGKTHTIKVTYGGDTIFKPSTGSLKQVVDKYPTATALSSSLNPSHYGQAVTFTATVAPSGPYPPTGKVKLWDGTTSLGTALLNGGVAQLTKSKLAMGTHPITAQYLGDATSDKSTSPVVNQVVQ
ncbi:MAG: Ig-like domain repeat protein [Acidobacteriia bacterium]|nr:Ig-like domain repeat protein [Terriglobia bacterium]